MNPSGNNIFATSVDWREATSVRRSNIAITINDIIAQGLPVSLALGTAAFASRWGRGSLGFHRVRGNWDEYAASFSVLAICIPGLVIRPVW
jgi:hypothetical protein